MVDAYLVEVTTPTGEKRREIYHTQNAADQTVAMYARSGENWQTKVFPLTKLPDANDSQASGSGDA